MPSMRLTNFVRTRQKFFRGRAFRKNQIGVSTKMVNFRRDNRLIFRCSERVVEFLELWKDVARLVQSTLSKQDPV